VKLIEITDLYNEHRLTHGVMDSIRFTARDLQMAPVDVARRLDLTAYFLEHRA
jgi:hypothetical protein